MKFPDGSLQGFICLFYFSLPTLHTIPIIITISPVKTPRSLWRTTLNVRFTNKSWLFLSKISSQMVFATIWPNVGPIASEERGASALRKVIRGLRLTDCVQLSRGVLRWQSTRARKPLILVGNIWGAMPVVGLGVEGLRRQAITCRLSEEAPYHYVDAGQRRAFFYSF